MKKKTNEDFIKEVYEQVGNEYTFLEEYKGTKIKLKVKHNKCGYIYEIKPNYFLSNKCRCPKCSKKIISNKKRKTNEEFIKEVYEQVGNEYTFLENYINDKTKLKIKHNKCDNIYEVTPNNFLRRKRRCPYCCKRNVKRSNEEFIKEVYELVGDEYIFLENYINTDTPIKVKHKLCNNEYTVAPKEFLFKKARCPYCDRNNKNSIFCKDIENFFKENSISFKVEKHCLEFSKSKSFDFLIDNYIYLEFDGKQHFTLAFNNTEEELQAQIQRDTEKFKFFINNSKYSFIRISYKNKKNLKQILNEIFINGSTTIEKLNKFDNLLYIKNGKLIIKKGDYQNLYN